MDRLRCSITAAALILGAGSAYAEAAGGTPSLADAVEAAWGKATQAAQVSGQARQARAEGVVAGSLWAAPPSLELSHRDDRLQASRGVRESEIGIAFPIWLPGQKVARGATADAQARLADGEAAVARLQIAGQVREAWGEVLSQRAERQAIERQATLLDALASDVDRRVRAGDLARADALATRAEVLAARTLRIEAGNREAAALGRWNALTGLDELPEQAEEPAPTAAVILDSHPVISLASLSYEFAQRRLSLVRASERAPPEMIARWRQDAAGRSEPDVNTIGLGVRIPFGTDGRNAPLLSAALTEVEVAQANERLRRHQLAAELQVALASRQAAEAQLDTERSREALLRERAALIDRAFRAGEMSLPELLRALTAHAQAESARARQQVAVRLSKSRVKQALGVMP